VSTAPAGRAARYARNLASFGLKTVFSAGLNLALTAFLIRRLGTEDFGLWSVALTVGGSLGLVDLNPTGAVIKHSAELHAGGRLHEVEGVLGAALRLAFKLCAAGFAIAAVGLSWALPRLFKTQAHDPAVLWALVLLCLGAFTVQLVAGVYQQALAGLKRQDEVNLVLVLSTVASALGQTAAVLFHAPLWALGLAQLGGALLSLFLSAWRLQRLVPGLPLLPSKGSDAWKDEVWRLGAGGYAFTLWGWAYFTLPRMILAAWLGPVPVAWVEAASKLGHFVRNLTQTLSYYLVPFLSELGVVEGHGRLSQVRLRALPLIWMAGLLLAGPLIAFRAPLLQLWLGLGDEAARAAVFWVVLEFSFGGFVMPLVHFAFAEGKLRYTWPFLAYMVPACVGFPALGLWLGGFNGYLAASALANIAGMLFMHGLSLRHWKAAPGPLLREAAAIVLPWSLAVAWALRWPVEGRLSLALGGAALGLLLLGAWRALGAWQWPLKVLR